MSEPGSESVNWYYSEPSAVIPLDSWSIPRSLIQFLKSPVTAGWTVETDTDFAAVIDACSYRPDTWISEIIKRSYINLNREGYAHSVEIRNEGRLIGGLYGVKIGSAFFGESMFHRQPNASKTALAVLLHSLTGTGFGLLDIQMMTPVMKQFGAISIPREEYMDQLQYALGRNAVFRQVKELRIHNYLDFL